MCPRRTSGRLRVAKQRLKKQYMLEREDRQLSGAEPTVPAGAIKSEVVDPSTQSESLKDLPALVRQALEGGWPTTDSAKARATSELMAALSDPDTSPRMRVRLFRLLRVLDGQ